MKRAGHSVSRARPLCDGVGKQDGFRIQNGGEAAVHPGRVNLGQIGYIHVSAFQTPCRSDDVQPVRQRVLVPVNVIEGAVHLLIVLSRGPHAGLAEIDPTWVDSSLTTILNPEAILFANPIAQGACAADAMASAFHMPLDILFWCAGSQGSMYPFSGWVSNESSPLQSSLLVSERMAYKLHRQGQIMESIGKDKAVCYEYPSPIIPKERWRYQMVNMYPDSGQCHPVGRSVMRWEAGKNPPNTRKNYGYLMWRKRNCVFL